MLPIIKTNVYQDNGYADRDDYLKSLSEDLGIDLETVQAAADMLGESEDFDGLVTNLEDFADGF